MAASIDSKPTLAKEFFEPLLDVAIFRESTSRLAEAHARFKELLEEQNSKMAATAERIRLLAGSVEKVAVKEAEIESLTKAVEKSRKQKEEADKLKQRWELKQKAFDSARTMLEEAKNQHRLASQKRESDQQRLNESLEAVSIVKLTEPGYQACIKAGARLRLLHQQQKEKSVLESQRSEALNSRTQWEAKKIGAQKQAQDYQAQREQKKSQGEVHRRQLEARKLLDKTKAEFEKLTSITAVAKHAREALGAWIEGLSGYLEDSKRLLADIFLRWERIQTWDAKAFLQVKADEQRLEQVARELATRLAKAEEAKATLERQLAQINGGVCPFLKTQCRQFDPNAVQSDIAGRDKEILAIRKELKESVEKYEGVKRTAEKLSKQESELTHLRSSLEEKVAAFVGRHNEVFPTAIRKHMAVVHGYLPAHLNSPLPLVLPMAEKF